MNLPAVMSHMVHDRGICPLQLSELRAPGLIMMANRYNHREKRMHTPFCPTQSSDTVKPSFSQNVFLLLMLG